MARDTGGELFENFNDLGVAMQKLLARTSVTYLLSYQPQDLDFDGKYRKLKVKLQGVDDARVVHRPGYFAPNAKKGQDDFGTLLASGQQLLDRRNGEIDARILAVPLLQEVDGRRYVPTLIDIRGATFFPPPVPGREPPATARADVFLYAFDRQGGIADYFSQAVNLDLAQAGETFAKTASGSTRRCSCRPASSPCGSWCATRRAAAAAPPAPPSPSSPRRPSRQRGGTDRPPAAAPARGARPVDPGARPAQGSRRQNRARLPSPSLPCSTRRWPSRVLRAGERLPLLIAGWGLQDLRLEARLLERRAAPRPRRIALTYLRQSHGDRGRHDPAAGRLHRAQRCRPATTS